MKFSSKVMSLAYCALLFSSQMAVAGDLPSMPWRGFNFPQATFGTGKPNVVYSKDYLYQSPADIDLYAKQGANIFRVGFLWERVQPSLNQPLDPQELARIDGLVAEAESQHVILLLDVHNYGGYNGNLIGSAEVPTVAFDDLWTRLADHYKGHSLVMFGLMNEPNRHTATDWAGIAQNAINAIRKTGAAQTIFVPGTKWDGAHSWYDKAGDQSNAEALSQIKDPGNNFIIEAHQYFDADSSGTKPTCASPDVGVKALSSFTQWLHDTHHKGFLGEFGASRIRPA